MPRRTISIHAWGRKDLDAFLYPSVDTFLRPLKATSRRLQVASTTLADEHQLLQRIYYKGKNQHRSALFWRRVVDLLRHSERVRNFDLPDLVLRLRCSFFGEDAFSNQSLLRGAWNHCPGPKSLDAVLAHILEARRLLYKFHERAVDAYSRSSFTVSMQSGAFIQILLVLAAISSRMRAVAQENLEIIDDLSKTIQGLKRELAQSPARGEVLPGEEVARATSFLTATVDKAAEPADGVHGSPELLVVQIGARLEETPTASTSTLDTSSKSDRSDLPLNASLESKPPKSATGSSSAKSKPRSSNNAAHSTKDRTKKRLRDEIDDIFGF
ncbi:hypothetical protein NMY22_g2472 [Coprinellus aureogranulatus]|nr:hypothetical protein NMY22_g2472 [Coprinellus aureogranulatus]